MKIEYFRAQKKTHRFRLNQKIWISDNFQNHLYICFKWRGKGRYVGGVIDKFHKCVGEIKEIDIDNYFGQKILEFNSRL